MMYVISVSSYYVKPFVGESQYLRDENGNILKFWDINECWEFIDSYFDDVRGLRFTFVSYEE